MKHANWDLYRSLKDTCQSFEEQIINVRKQAEDTLKACIDEFGDLKNGGLPMDFDRTCEVEVGDGILHECIPYAIRKKTFRWANKASTYLVVRFYDNVTEEYFEKEAAVLDAWGFKTLLDFVQFALENPSIDKILGDGE